MVKSQWFYIDDVMTFWSRSTQREGDACRICETSNKHFTTCVSALLSAHSASALPRDGLFIPSQSLCCSWCCGQPHGRTDVLVFTLKRHIITIIVAFAFYDIITIFNSSSPAAATVVAAAAPAASLCAVLVRQNLRYDLLRIDWGTVHRLRSPELCIWQRGRRT